jgi:REP element-mobilizing transposase RayT
MVDYNCDVLIYLFMTNHIHTIIKGKNDLSNSLRAIKMFKQKSGFWFSKNYPELKWQKDFYDHIIRNDKDIENQIYYILKNQMRENIIENWKDYEYKGSTIYDFNEWN